MFLHPKQQAEVLIQRIKEHEEVQILLRFSEADEDKLYLPVDSSDDAPTVEDQAQDPDSLYNTVKALTALRHEHDDLKADSSFAVIYAEKEEFPFVYRRGNLLIAINPSEKRDSTALPVEAFVKNSDASNKQCELKNIYTIGGSQVNGNTLVVDAQSFAVYKLV